MPKPVQDILDEIDCQCPSPISKDQFMYWVLGLLGNIALSGGGGGGAVVAPTFQPEEDSFVVPDVFLRLSTTTPSAIIRYNEGAIPSPSILYTDPIRANMSAAVGDTLTYHAQASDPSGLILSPVTSKTVSSTVPWSNVWNLDLNSNNSVGVTNLATFGSPVVFNTAPNFNTATFDGNGVLSLTTPVGMISPTFTISCWAKPVSIATYSALWMFEQGGSGSDGAGVVVFNDGSVLIQLLQSNGTYITAQTPPGAVTFGTFYNFVMTADGTNIKLYIDGVEVLTAAYNNTITNAAFFRFVVGGELNAVNVPVRGIVGSIDRVYYVNAGLTAPQVAQLYNEDLFYTKL